MAKKLTLALTLVVVFVGTLGVGLGSAAQSGGPSAEHDELQDEVEALRSELAVLQSDVDAMTATLNDQTDILIGIAGDLENVGAGSLDAGHNWWRAGFVTGFSQNVNHLNEFTIYNPNPYAVTAVVTIHSTDIDVELSGYGSWGVSQTYQWCGTGLFCTGGVQIVADGPVIPTGFSYYKNANGYSYGHNMEFTPLFAGS